MNQLPELTTQTYYTDEEPSQDEPQLSYDQVLREPVSLDEHVAGITLTRRAHNLGATRIGQMFATGRYWCQRVKF